jgi:hypothetical protein
MGKGALISYAKSKNYLKKLELKHRQTPVSKIFQQKQKLSVQPERLGQVKFLQYVLLRHEVQF